MSGIREEDIRKSVADFYDDVAKKKVDVKVDIGSLNEAIGYSSEDLESVPDEANMGLGCGNPNEAANPVEGETVLDLGCGKGMDVFISAKKVGESGFVIGVDMTYEMVTKARMIARKKGIVNVQFRLGEIEYLPVADNAVDIVISNCVINLSVDKQKVYDEIFRVLRPGGRISISDITLAKPLPEEVINDPKMYGT